MTDIPPIVAADKHLSFVANIVAAYVSNPRNKIGAEALADLIAAANAALKGLGEPAPDPTAPAVAGPSRRKISASITAEGLRSFINGKLHQSLKRHLKANGHTPESYRAAYGLPVDYPMVSPAYSARRSAVAKAIGLGRKPSRSETAAPPPGTLAAKSAKMRNETAAK